jgi:hypothetical protein
MYYVVTIAIIDYQSGGGEENENRIKNKRHFQDFLLEHKM